MKKTTIYILLVLVILIIGGLYFISNINNYKRDGSFKISKNKFPIQINRDENGKCVSFNLSQRFEGLPYQEIEQAWDEYSALFNFETNGPTH
jgi:hypothetical protein